MLQEHTLENILLNSLLSRASTDAQSIILRDMQNLQNEFFQFNTKLIFQCKATPNNLTKLLSTFLQD